MKYIAILGSTGSIGTQTLEVVRAQQDIKVTALSAGDNIDLLERQIREFKPVLAAVKTEEKAKERKLRTDGKAISRYFSIAPGSKFDFVFTAYQQAGKSADNGLIVPEGNPEIIIRVGCNAPDIKNFALLLQSHINGYISAQYATHSYSKAKES